MARAFRLPDLGEGIHEGEVLSVLVAAGDTVTEGDPILEVETDKAAVEIPSPFTGRVLEIRVGPGDTVQVGDVMMTFSDEETADAAAAGTGRAVRGEDRPTPKVEPAVEEPPPETPSPPQRRPDEGPIPASPATRRLARELGVDLRGVTPSGPGGRVTAEDVRRSAEGPATAPDAGAAEESLEPPAGSAHPAAAPPSLPDFSHWGPVESIALRSVRKATARRMALAWSQVPHVSSQDDVDVTRLETLRRRHKKTVEDQGGKLTLTVFAVKAAVAALKKYPQFNASLDIQKQAIIRKHYHHIGVAVDSGEGLLVPVIRDADRKSIVDIAVELSELVRRTRSRTISLTELQGGTFTITNIGAGGGRGHFSPIINYPEAAILGMSAARMQPVVRKKPDGEVFMVPRLIMPVVLTIDHRILDGVDSTKFLDFFRNAMQDPEKFLLTL
jgi:pyruvate dehydrogenase E2 component (dihydrolipoamide acetyltransferase)